VLTSSVLGILYLDSDEIGHDHRHPKHALTSWLRFVPQLWGSGELASVVFSAVYTPVVRSTQIDEHKELYDDCYVNACRF